MVVVIIFVGDPTLAKDKTNLQCISGANLILLSQFCDVD